MPDARPLCKGLREAYKAVEPNTVRVGLKGRNIADAMRAYQVSAAADLGMRDTPN